MCKTFFLRKISGRAMHQVVSYLLLFFCATFLLTNCNNSFSKKNHPTAKKGVLDLRNWNFAQNGPIKLTGEWEFYWKQFANDIKPNSPKTFVQAPTKWNNYLFQGHKIGSLGYGTYRLNILLPPEIKHYALKTGYWQSAVHIKANDTNFSFGKPARTRKDTHPVTAKKVFLFHVDDSQLTITAEVANFFHKNGGMIEAPEIGLSQQIIEKDNYKRLWQAMIIAAIFMFSLYHFVLFFMRRKDKSIFWFALFCLIICLRTLFVGEQLINVFLPQLDFRIQLFFDYFFMYLALICFMYFLHSLFPKEFIVLGRNILLTITLMLLATLLLPPEIYSHLLIVLQFVILALVIISLWVTAKAIYHHRPTSLLFLSGFIFLAIGIVLDIALSILLSTSTPFTLIGMTGFIFIQGIVISRRFNDAFILSEELSITNKKMQDKLIEQERLFTLGGVTATIIHDMKGPLNIINGYVSFLEEDNVSNKEKNEYLESITNEIEEMVDMTQEILDFSRGEISLEFTKRNFSIFLQELHDTLRIIYPINKVECSLEIEADVELNLDYKRFKRVLTNLIKNSVESFKGEAGKIIIKFHQENNNFILSISDNGSGIPEDIRENLFNTFVSSGKAMGTGLGTSIAQKVVEQHGGQIWFESELNKGTIFYISLPRNLVTSRGEINAL